MSMNVGELFKFLNSNVCDKFYQVLTYDNKKNIIDQMMNDESFMSLVHEYVSDDTVIRAKIDTKLLQLLKKNSCAKLVTPHELFLANLDGISNQLEKLSVVPCTNVVPSVHEIVEFDKDKGKHIGSGIYLKQEGHLMKMTTKDFTVYY
jgi:hypothetical protein